MRTRANKILKNQASQAVAASQTKQVVSNEFDLPARAMYGGLRIEVKVAASATVATGITAILQTALSGDATDTDWQDFDSTNAKITIANAASGWQTSMIVGPTNTNYVAKFPMRPRIRVVVTTGSGDSVTISDVRCICADD